MADFRQFLVEQVGTDCTFVFKNKEGNDVTLKCHKVILAAASPVFKTMFFGSLPEQGPVIISDTTYAIFYLFVQQMYGHDEQIRTPDGAVGLYQVAHKYVYQAAIEKARSYILANCKINETAEKFYEVAVKYSDDEIKKKCFETIGPEVLEYIKDCSFSAGIKAGMTLEYITTKTKVYPGAVEKFNEEWTKYVSNYLDSIKANYSLTARTKCALSATRYFLNVANDTLALLGGTSEHGSRTKIVIVQCDEENQPIWFRVAGDAFKVTWSSKGGILHKIPQP